LIKLLTVLQDRPAWKASKIMNSNQQKLLRPDMPHSSS